MRFTDEQLLQLVGQERKRSIGFGEGDGGELEKARELALAYTKGEMKDVPSLPNRSAVKDSTIADAIETVMPDVMEVFIGGEDVATFVPEGEDDENAAQEETDFVHHVVFTENEGFLNLYSAIKDSLLTRTGLIHWWWEEDEKTETVAQAPAEEAQLMQAVAGVMGQELEAQEPAEEGGQASLNVTKLHGKVKMRAVPSEDFSIAPDAVSLRDTTYCVMRDRPRVQDLIARGIDPEKARSLKTYGSPKGEETREARDHAQETETSLDGGDNDLRVVEVRAHFIRLASDDSGKLKVWRVITDSEEKVLLDKDEVDGIHFAGFTPYIVPHRFIGESVADKLMEVQRIKTVLLRNHLDSVYFALNQRMEVADSHANEFTIADLLRNEPGVPVRTKQVGGLNAISAGALNVDMLASLEFASTMAESRSGIVRNAQGLNPDTLHDTAKGAMALISAAQKRVRMIARIFAETGIKDLFVGVHCMLRKAYSAEGKAYQPIAKKFGQQWKSAAPDEWRERCAMNVHVGVGSAGREQDLAMAGQRLEIMNGLIGQQGGVEGPFVDQTNVHNALRAWERSTGTKNPEQYWSDPKTAPAQPPKPDPEMEKAKAQLAIQQEKNAGELQLQREKAATDAQTAAQKHVLDAQAAEAKARRDFELKMAEIQSAGELQRYQIDQEIQLRREEQIANVQLERERMLFQQASDPGAGALRETEPGGEPG